MLAVDDFFLQLERLLFNFRNRSTQRHVHVGIRIGRFQSVVQPVNNHFAGLPVLFDRQDYVHRNGIAVKKRRQLSELLFDMTTNCRRNFYVPARIFKRHSRSHPPVSRSSLNYCSPLARTGNVHLVPVLGNGPARQFDSVFHQYFYHLIIRDRIVRIFFFYQFFDL